MCSHISFLKRNTTAILAVSLTINKSNCDVVLLETGMIILFEITQVHDFLVH